MFSRYNRFFSVGSARHNKGLSSISETLHKFPANGRLCTCSKLPLLIRPARVVCESIEFSIYKVAGLHYADLLERDSVKNVSYFILTNF